MVKQIRVSLDDEQFQAAKNIRRYCGLTWVEFITTATNLITVNAETIKAYKEAKTDAKV